MSRCVSCRMLIQDESKSKRPGYASLSATTALCNVKYIKDVCVKVGVLGASAFLPGIGGVRCRLGRVATSTVDGAGAGAG